MAKVLWRHGADVKAEARWPRIDNRDGNEDDLANGNGTESLSERLYQVLLEQSPRANIQAKVTQALTPAQLAESGGHDELQWLLGMQPANS